MSFAFIFPLVFGPNGLQPQSPASLQTQLLGSVQDQSPGYADRLPPQMVIDLSTTDDGAIGIMDQAKIAAVNALTPFGANQFLLTQLGNIYGTTLGKATNTSVLLVFNSPNVGFFIPNGFLVSDGTNTYQVQVGGSIAIDGFSPPILAICITPGSFAVPANTVVAIQSSFPRTVTLAVTNPLAGTPGQDAETLFLFRGKTLKAGIAASTGTSAFIETAITRVSGVATNDVAVQRTGAGLIRVIATGGDPNAIAQAIFNSMGNVGVLTGSAISSTRNIAVSVADYPNSYQIVYVNTQVQAVTMAITWNTSLTSFSDGDAFAGLVQAPLAEYINTLTPGQVINILEMNEIFQQAIVALLDPILLTRLVFTVSINGTPTAPLTGSFAVQGDPESNFNCQPSDITVAQG